jgi:hypothetical protein
MKTRGALPALALAALFAVAAPEARADHKGKIPWVTDPTQGFAQARREGKPTGEAPASSWQLLPSLTTRWSRPAARSSPSWWTAPRAARTRT